MSFRKLGIAYCEICARKVGVHGWLSHITSTVHNNYAAQLGVFAYIQPKEPPLFDGDWFCQVCQIFVRQSLWLHHVSGQPHQAQERYRILLEKLSEAEKDKGGVVVGGCFDLGYVTPMAAERGVHTALTVTSEDISGRIVLVNAYFASLYAGRPVSSGFSISGGDIGRPISKSNPAVITYSFQGYFLGRYDDAVELIFQDVYTNLQFLIRRRLDAIIGDQHQYEYLKPIAPYRPPPKINRQTELYIVEGIPPPALKTVQYTIPLPHVHIPRFLLDILAPDDLDSRQKLARIQKLHPPKFNVNTHSKHFRHLLWYEEQKMEADLSRYDMTDATLQQFNNLYYLAVPGLAEKRPSVLIGDRMLVQEINSARGHWFEGHVHVVRQTEVGLRFHESFTGWAPGTRFNVRFKLNRTVLRRQHQAMDSPFNDERVLFPAPQHLKSTPAEANVLDVYNNPIANNPQQLRAVTSIAHQPACAAPFVVFGPPGTGKTITIVEAMMQLLRINSGAHILACAPSNSAADLIADRLSTFLTPSELFRLYAVSRSPSDIPAKLIPFTCTTPDNIFTVPPIPVLLGARVIVATCVGSSTLKGVGLEPGHFTHIFVDEAGQGTETETLIPIKTLSGRSTNIILSGDPKQLGPTVRSGIARHFGFEMSYLERLMNRPAYDLTRHQGTSIVQLTMNFRSHHAILNFPNDQFYGGHLVPSADLNLVNTYLSSPLLPSPAFPVIFHAVNGKDERESTSPSFFNIDEVLTVKAYVEKLRADRHVWTADDDIGVIAPYHAQCLKIRAALRGVADSVKVASIEEFQGQERKVIIVSTVRSSKEFLDYDLYHTLGFVANPRRFNVAVTRAQALLIVIGDPHVLGLDPLWRSFLNYVHTNKGWVGPEIPWDPSVPVIASPRADQAGSTGKKPFRYDVAVRKAVEADMNEAARRADKLTLQQMEDADPNIERPWRNEE